MKLNIYTAIVVVLVAFAVLTGIQYAVQTVDASTIAPEWQTTWQAIVYIFTTSAATPLFTFLRNMLGYAENWFEANPDERNAMHYEAGKLGATWTKFQVYIMGFTAAIQALTIGTPLQQHAVYIAGAIGIVADLVLKAINDLKASPATPS